MDGMRSKITAKRVGGIRILDLEDIMEWTAIEQASSFIPSLWSYVDDIVGIGNDVEIVFDDHDGIPLVHEAFQDFQELLDIGKMKPRRGFVQNIQGFRSGTLRKVERELDTLGFSSRKRRCRLAEPDVAESNIH